MLILRSGITGFQPAPSVEELEFKQICYSLFGSKALDYTEDETAKNFYECILKVKDKKVHVLLNAQYPFIAFTATRELDVLHFPFINEPELSTIFEQYYEVLNLNQLNEPLRYTQKGKKIIVQNENTLHQDELEQLIYWQPKTVGAVVFNDWD
ncbi:hypothetical protein [Oceanobacillus bengalensis]|uniref:Uncharacterized protein n=1 Tax=Oceanobacillus bengalensis TaxID=1435466 RepID=A0A494Z3R3_9BACI|nr:hypothetical protein [Oceanobacillus bengalensis]RKQ17120.1 hypothetical protein D8M05_05470 [Oceanobacillus bengalensis]